MAASAPTIIWRNPDLHGRRRLWNRARHDERMSLYIVVRSNDRESEWEGLPNLEVLRGGRSQTPASEDRSAQSRG